MADTRALQRKVNRLKQIQTYAAGNLTKEPIERIKANIKLLSEEWHDYKTTAHTYGDSADNIALQEKFESKYYTIKGKLIEAELTLDNGLHAANLDTSLQELMTNQRSFLQEVTTLANKGDSDVHLPRVNIPFFTGIYSEFASFRDLFEASIHSNPKMSKVHKLQYLKGLLKGEAAALVRHIAITEANYDETWTMIVNRYDKKKQVITMFLKQFMEQPTISQVSAKALHHMRDVSDEVIRGIKVLAKEAQSRDPWLIYILLNKLDQTTKQAWAQHSYEISFPTIEQFLDFLGKQSDTLESCEPTKRSSHRQTAPSTSVKVMHLDTQFESCLKCGQEHYLRNCDVFLQLPISERRGFVADNKLCFVCLYQNHQSRNCRSRYRCGICRAKHHTTLHQEAKQMPKETTALSTEVIQGASGSSEANAASMNVLHASSNKRYTSILPTAVVRVLDSSNQYQRCRVLLDSGAQASFISESCARRLALPRTNARILIKGLTPGTETTKGKLSIKAVSLYSDADQIYLDVFILNKLTDCLPSREITTINFKEIHGLQLADPHFYKPEAVDIILGADRFFSIIKEGQINNISHNLVAQNSMFGWIVSGEAAVDKNKSILNYHIDLNVDEALRKFWEIEEIPAIKVKLLSEEESACEEHYKTNLSLHDSGKYLVKLPFKDSRITLGNSLNVARKRFFNLEAKLNRDPELKSEYIKVMREYLSLGHMCEITRECQNKPDDQCFYLPHHAVTKKESSTTKLRVVFDGSSKTSNGNSINDALMVGPTIQPTLWTTLMMFRYNKIALTADIVKMYRQVLVAEEDQEFQRILWRENANETLKYYRLTTVTFGMASSAFLAIRSLQQTAIDFREDPIIAKEILTKFYVDDYLSGANTVEEGAYLRDKLSQVLQQRGFQLRKWRSNATELIDQPTEWVESLVPIDAAITSTIICQGRIQWKKVHT